MERTLVKAHKANAAMTRQCRCLGRSCKTQVDGSNNDQELVRSAAPGRRAPSGAHATPRPRFCRHPTPGLMMQTKRRLMEKRNARMKPGIKPAR